MTTIAYRNGVMAADRRAYSGSATPIGNKTKIKQLEDGTIVGVSTPTPGLGEAFIRYIEDAACVPECNEMNLAALVVRPDGKVFYYNDALMPSGPLDSEFFAIGSGDCYALAAMHMGADAAKAVRVASEFDRWTNDQVDILRSSKVTKLAG